MAMPDLPPGLLETLQRDFHGRIYKGDLTIDFQLDAETGELAILVHFTQHAGWGMVFAPLQAPPVADKPRLHS